jgi:hypothetical protein
LTTKSRATDLADEGVWMTASAVIRVFEADLL